jgi:hypothetical protein
VIRLSELKLPLSALPVEARRAADAARGRDDELGEPVEVVDGGTEAEEVREAAEKAISELREVLNGDDVDAINKKMEESFPKLMPVLEASQQAAAAKEAEFDTSGAEETPKETKRARKKKGTTDENTVDAQFTEVK